MKKKKLWVAGILAASMVFTGCGGSSAGAEYGRICRIKCRDKGCGE